MKKARRPVLKTKTTKSIAKEPQLLNFVNTGLLLLILIRQEALSNKIEGLITELEWKIGEWIQASNVAMAQFYFQFEASVRSILSLFGEGSGS